MKEKFKALEKLVGNTPLITIQYKYQNEIKKASFKAEWYNLSGSIKDRVAIEMLKEAYGQGVLRKGQTICEVTSGNMGISLAAITRILGNPLIICMPKFMSHERITLLEMYGAKVELYDSFDECFIASERHKTKGCFLTYQFESRANYRAHYQTTAVEIERQAKEMKAFLAGVGTSGTLSGVGHYFKQRYNSLVYALEPTESQILSKKKSHGPHGIQGLSDDIIPELFDYNIIDGIINVSTEDSIAMAQKLCKVLGLGVGISSGANFLGSVLTGIDGIVSVFADNQMKYLSTALAHEIRTPLVDEIELLNFTVTL